MGAFLRPLLTIVVLRILKILQADPHASHRRVTDGLGISFGRVHYCLQALIEKSLIKAKNVRNSASKRAYLYLLTPSGIEENSIVTARFLRRKLDEYETMKRELEGAAARGSTCRPRRSEKGVTAVLLKNRKILINGTDGFIGPYLPSPTLTERPEGWLRLPISFRIAL